MNINKVKLKVKAMSLAEEAKIIRRLERDCYDKNGHNEIRNHRINEVRDESRATNLARAFLSGKFYRQVEPSRRFEKECSFPRIAKRTTAIVRKYGNFKNGQAEETVNAWLSN